MAFTLPALPYAPDALEPHIDKTDDGDPSTASIISAYVTNLNKALESAPDLQNKSIEELLANNCAIVPENIRTAVRNNGGGHINHSMFWKIMGPGKGGAPVGNLAQAITALSAVSITFKEKFNAAGAGRFGSGWAWLLKSGNGRGDYVDAESGQPGDGRQVSGDRPGCVGARVLSEVSEPPAGLHWRRGGTL